MSTKQLNEQEIDQLRPLIRDVINSIDSYLMEEVGMDMYKENGEYDEEKLRVIVQHIGEQLINY